MTWARSARTSSTRSLSSLSAAASRRCWTALAIATACRHARLRGRAAGRASMMQARERATHVAHAKSARLRITTSSLMRASSGFASGSGASRTARSKNRRLCSASKVIASQKNAWNGAGSAGTGRCSRLERRPRRESTELQKHGQGRVQGCEGRGAALRRAILERGQADHVAVVEMHAAVAADEALIAREPFEGFAKRGARVAGASRPWKVAACTCSATRRPNASIPDLMLGPPPDAAWRSRRRARWQRPVPPGRCSRRCKQFPSWPTVLSVDRPTAAIPAWVIGFTMGSGDAGTFLSGASGVARACARRDPFPPARCGTRRGPCRRLAAPPGQLQRLGLAGFLQLQFDEDLAASSATR